MSSAEGAPSPDRSAPETPPVASGKPWVPSSDERYALFLVRNFEQLASVPLHGPDTLRRSRRVDVLDAALGQITRQGALLEFGVYRGVTIRRTAKRFPDRKIYGFDSFKGFPDDGRPDWRIDFAVSRKPRVPGNVTLVEGFFSDSLPPFVESLQDPIAFVNIDCDIYSSTKDVFAALGSHLEPGTVLYFDELVNYPQFAWNEFLALYEFLEERRLGMRWIAHHSRLHSIEALIEMSKKRRDPRQSFHDRLKGYQIPAAGILTDDYPLDRWIAEADDATKERVRKIARGLSVQRKGRARRAAQAGTSRPMQKLDFAWRFQRFVQRMRFRLGLDRDRG